MPDRIAVRSPYRPAAAMFVVGWGANMFTPLLMVYAVALSDTALAVVFATAGAAFGPGTVWLNELNAQSGSSRSAATLTTIALTAGFAVGPLATGVLAQWLPWPCALGYLVHLVLLLLAAPVVWFAPETAPRRSAARGRSMAGSALRHPLFARVMLPTAPWVFGGVVAAIVVLPQNADLGEFEIAATGGLAALTLLTGVCVQPIAARTAARSGLGAVFVDGLVLLVTGLIIGAAMEVTHWTLLLFLAAAPLGAAYGFLLTGGLKLIPVITTPEHRSLVTGIFYVLAYSGYFWSILVNALVPVVPKAVSFSVSAVVVLLTLVPVRSRQARAALQQAPSRPEQACAHP